MINGASEVPPGCNGVKIVPKFYEEMKGEPGGKILGLTMIQPGMNLQGYA